MAAQSARDQVVSLPHEFRRLSALSIHPMNRNNNRYRPPAVDGQKCRPHRSCGRGGRLSSSILLASTPRDLCEVSPNTWSILFCRQGTIVELGPHDTLIQNPTGVYRTLVARQLEVVDGGGGSS